MNVNTEIYRDQSGKLQSVVLVGQVQIGQGVEDAEKKVRAFLGKQTYALHNRIEPGGGWDQPKRSISDFVGCWQRLAENAECSSNWQTNDQNKQCGSVPQKFHLRKVCFDSMDGDKVKIRMTFSHSHTYGSELPEDPNDLLVIEAIGHDKSTALMRDEYFIMLDPVASGERSSVYGSEVKLLYFLRFDFGRHLVLGFPADVRADSVFHYSEAQQTLNSIRMVGYGEWRCPEVSKVQEQIDSLAKSHDFGVYFTSRQEGEFIKEGTGNKVLFSSH
jgi:hypothetical protein